MTADPTTETATESPAAPGAVGPDAAAGAPPLVGFDSVDVVFGDRVKPALDLADQGLGREEILAQTGCTVAVRNASLDIAEGELCVLMGLSGSGKSSLLRCVNGLNPITRGRVVVRCAGEEIDVGAAGARQLKRLRSDWVSMVFQQFALMPWRTVRDNVGLGLEFRGVPKAERRHMVEAQLEMVRLVEWADKYPAELSGGMQQRVGLARAFATGSDILLMDEPFSALDPLIRSHLQDELLELQRRLKKTILFVSHDLDEALKIGNRIVIMEGGRIVQVGRPEQIVTRPASEYVANFVANVNPLNVLRGRTLMVTLDTLPAVENGRRLEDGSLVRLDERGRPARVVEPDGQERGPINYGRPEAAGPGDWASAPAEIPMREVIELRHRTQRPVLMTDPSGRLVGVVGEGEIVNALLNQSRAENGVNAQK